MAKDDRTQQVLGLLVDMALAEPGEYVAPGPAPAHDRFDQVITELRSLRKRSLNTDVDAQKYKDIFVESLAETIHDVAQAGLRRKVAELDEAKRSLESVNADLQRSNFELERFSAKLAQTQKMEALGKLAGGVAHDLNNILTVITSFAGFVRESLKPGEQRYDDVLEILSATDRASQLVRQLLLFSRQDPHEMTPLDLESVLGGIATLLRRTIGEDIELEVSAVTDKGTGAGGLLVLGDAIQLDQLLLNLAVNARDAMPAGGRLSITADTVVVEPGTTNGGLGPGTYCRLTIEDTGIGIDPNIMPRIFEPFFSTKNPADGTGLGLSTCYGIAKQLDGAIQATSEVGKGSSFVVLLPKFEGPRRVDSEAEVVTPSSAESGVILVVEDEPLVRRVAERALRADGYRLLGAGDAVEALALFEQHADSIDMVFSDVVLPRGNGFELAREIRKRGHQTPVLLTSGYTDHRAPKETEIPLLWKPYTPEDLIRRVRACLDDSRS